MAHEFGRPFDPAPRPAGDEARIEVPVRVGAGERRMHARAYDHWATLLRGGNLPAIGDLDPAAIARFAPHGVLLDFAADDRNPVIRHLGATLRAECGIAEPIVHMDQAPAGSLLARLPGLCRQVIANRAPIGFEAECVDLRDRNSLYRGILLPFSSSGGSVDFIYGVINGKERADAATEAQIAAELARLGPAGANGKSARPQPDLVAIDTFSSPQALRSRSRARIASGHEDNDDVADAGVRGAAARRSTAGRAGGV
ncbi:hypothetical protein ACMGDH_13820 [Sphingomonas sp. DT-207]|uniref:hypothetical protein n=1 Tax=Sphingomonas sp. DT-207 TaxID=3396167 RepID=UPI003F1CE270